MKKNILVDFSKYDAMCGFGEICRNYAPKLAGRDYDDLHFIFLIPEKWCGYFGGNIDYISTEKAKKQLREYTGRIDLWHSTDQQFKYSFKSIKHRPLTLLTIHDLNYLYEKRGLHKLRHILEMRHFVNMYDNIAVISDFVRKDVERNFNLRGRKVERIYNGISNVEDRPKERPAFVTGENRKFFFTIGQVRTKKNFKTLVPVMDYFPDYKLYICGDDHWRYSNDIRDIIKPHDSKRILVTGKISEAEKCWLYDNCAAFLFPSTLEGFGIPVLEAMRFKAKVISSKFTCLPEVCGEYASYWDDFEPQHMADVVRRAITGYNKESDYAVNARKHSMDFNYDRYTDEYVDLYRKILSYRI